MSKKQDYAEANKELETIRDQMAIISAPEWHTYDIDLTLRCLANAIRTLAWQLERSR